MIITLLGAYIVILGLVTLTCFKVTSVLEILTTNCMFWILVLCGFNVVWLIKKDCALYDLHHSGVYSREIINMFFVSVWICPKFNIGVFSDINTINDKLCMMVLLTVPYLSVLPVLVTIFQGHSKVNQF